MRYRLKPPTGKHLVSPYIAVVFCPIQHILKYITPFMKIAIEAPILIVRQHGGCFPFSFVISKVTTSHENALLEESWGGQWLGMGLLYSGPGYEPIICFTHCKQSNLEVCLYRNKSRNAGLVPKQCRLLSWSDCN